MTTTKLYRDLGAANMEIMRLRSQLNRMRGENHQIRIAYDMYIHSDGNVNNRLVDFGKNVAAIMEIRKKKEEIKKKEILKRIKMRINKVNQENKFKLKFSREEITPKRAKYLLRKNYLKDFGQNPSKSAIKTYAQIMKAGKWVLAHNGISISDTGVVIDGVHRLYAIIEAGVSISMIVYRGYPITAYLDSLSKSVKIKNSKEEKNNEI